MYSLTEEQLAVQDLVRRVARRSPVTGGRWWEAERGSANAPAVVVLVGMDRAIWPRRVPGRPFWIGAALVIVALVGVTAWSATLEPAASDAPTTAEGAALCDDLAVFEQLVGQTGSRPEVLTKVVPTVDRLLRVAPPDLVQPLSTIRVEVAAYLASGSDPKYYASIGPERQQRLLDAVREVAEARATRC